MKSFSDKRILIAGAGAIGSFYGGLIARAGYDVELLARGAHLAAMQKSGRLIINSWKFETPENVSIKAVSGASDVYDIIIICVKSQDTAEMCARLKDNLADDGCIVSFQNGVENPEIMAGFFSADKVLGASLFAGLWIEPAGQVNHTASGDCIFGALTEKGKSHEAYLKEIFDNSKIPSDISHSIKHTLWRKLVWNAAYNPLSALLESTCGPMIKSETLSPLIEKMVLEVVEAAKHHGVTITEQEWRDKIAYRDSLERYKTSMLQDIERLRNPEIDGILGPVVRTLEKAGSSAPYCETVFRAVEFKYGKHFIYCPRLTVDVVVRRDDSLLLIERRYEPLGWALPGGFVDYGEKVEAAAARELMEETRIEAQDMKMLGVYSDPERDKRGHTVSVVYSCKTDMNPKAGDDAKNAQFFELDKLPNDICFDHLKIIKDYLLKM